MHSKSQLPIGQTARTQSWVRKTTSLLTATTLAGILLSGVFVSVGAFRATAATSAEDRAKGEEMLKKARLDAAQARQLQEASIKLSQVAQQDMAKANQKRTEARALVREAYLLIRDSNRMRADELRDQAEAKDMTRKTEEGELGRLTALIAEQKQVAADATAASAKLQDAARNESNTAEKTALANMSESLVKQAAQATAEAGALGKRADALNAEIARLTTESKALIDEANHLAPPTAK